jgi:hypothetical protein
MIIRPFTVTNLAGALLSGCARAGPHSGPPIERSDRGVARLCAVRLWDDGP